MREVIEKMVERISAYEFLNNIAPGVVYVVLVDRFTSFHVQTGNIWTDLVIIYFIGLVIGRIGSLVIGRILERAVKSDFVQHSEYIIAEKKDSSVRELSTICNMYRTYASVALCLFFTLLLNDIWPCIKGVVWVKQLLLLCACLILMIIFLMVSVKQTRYVADSVKTINNELMGPVHGNKE